MRRRVDLNQLPGILGLALAILIALAPTNALAQSRPAQGGAAPPKAPPPPLFPRHRRGIYTNSQGIEVTDATPQSPPLEIDDPGVPDKGEYEINLSIQADLSKAENTVDLLFVDANYGVLPKIAGHELPTQLKFEFPVRAARESDDPYAVGIGAAKVGVKLNFYNNEHSGLSVAFYPQLEFETPGTDSIQKGLAEPGQTLFLPLLLAKEFHYFTFVGNGGVEIPVHAPGRETTTIVGAGIGRAFTRKVAAMIEVRNESALDFQSNHLTLLNVGFIHGVRNVIVYTKLGHSLFSDDGSGHTYIGVGMKLLVNQKK
jgi:hypothetical protein